MGKGTRSKRKRANRTEFRRTIGEEFARAKMEITQAKLQECVKKGSTITSSIERLSSLFNNNDTTTTTATMTMDVDTGDVAPTTTTTTTTVDQEKIPPLKKNIKKKHWIDEPVGQTGARLARKRISKMNQRGQMKNGAMVYKTKERKVRKQR